MAKHVLILMVGLMAGYAWAETLSLDGDWKFELDPEDAGVAARWFERDLPDTVHLPGTTDENGYGTATTEKKISMLSRVHEYLGAAWYQKTVVIPPEWAGKRITLFLERCHWETRAWVDGETAGMQDSLCTPHVYDLSTLLTPGLHRITLRVDNTVKYNVGINAHSITEHTQTNWNGIIGRIELQVTDPVYLAQVQAFPHAGDRSVTARVTVRNACTATARGKVEVAVDPVVGEMVFEVPAGESRTVEVALQMGDHVRFWDEFSPETIPCRTVLTAAVSGQTFQDATEFQVGFRDLGSSEGYITVNGRPTLMRGNLECCIFPQTGYPAMNTGDWLKLFQTAKTYGINHVRFHSWCPPEAAFAAADQLGIMFHVETPVWTELGSDEALDRFVYAESDRILAAYGNHPSFCMLAVGNEPSGKKKDEFLKGIVAYWREKDARRLYTTCAGWPALPGSDYHVRHEGNGKPYRLHGGPLGPYTNFDYGEVLAGADAPVIAHELGQWCVYPNYAEISRYTGTLRARNLETFRDSLDAHHMLDQNAAFTKASGALQTLLYKADIEAVLRTPGAAGFQLLSLQDFPGQGTALVGFLTAFWDAKGYTPPEQFREFNNETAPLLRLDRYTWSTQETLHAEAQIAHFGKAPLTGAVPAWTVTYPDGRMLASGAWEPRDIPWGSGIPLGAMDVKLADVEAPTKLTITFSLKDTALKNHWDVWVYPARFEEPADNKVYVAGRFDENVEKTLEAGGTVLLYSAPLSRQYGVKSAFESIFWNTQWFPSQTRQLGVLCDPAHPAFRLFPNDGHTDWQWWDLLNQSTVMNLDHFPATFRPLVQVIDDWNRNRKLGAIFEAKVGPGRLLACSLTGGKESLAAAWLRNSLIRYAASPDFAPECAVDLASIRELFQEPALEVVHVDSEVPGYEGMNAVDGDPATIWHTPWERRVPPYPHEIQVRLRQEATIEGLSCLPRQDVANAFIRDYEVYVSQDGKEWGQPVAKGAFERGPARKDIHFAAESKGQYIRLVALSGYNDEDFAALAEIIPMLR